MNRRHFLELTALAGVAAIAPAARCAPSGESIVNDVSDLNPVHVARVQRPRSTDDVRVALRAWSGRVSVGGGRFSMGGQIAAPDSLHLDMRAMNEIVSLDVAGRRVRVQAGTTWRDVLDRIDPHDLAVRVMQSYSNFTVGGSVSVNCHGRYVGKGPLVNSVRAVQIVTVDGEVLELTRERDSECFAGVFGGYGGLGVITEVELDLDTNDAIERRVHDVRLGDYPAFFRETILRDPRVMLHNADLTPPSFAWPRAISWMTTDRQVTVADRLIPRGLDYSLEQNAIWVMTELPGGKLLREGIVDRINLAGKPVVWRNHEASLDTASLEPRTRSMSTYLLQEYFIPVGNFVPFARRMAAILRERGVNALNVSIRHSPPDTQSLMRWAPTEVFSFVLYYKQLHTEAASRAASAWTLLLERIELKARKNGEEYSWRHRGIGGMDGRGYARQPCVTHAMGRVRSGRKGADVHAADAVRKARDRLRGVARRRLDRRADHRTHSRCVVGGGGHTPRRLPSDPRLSLGSVPCLVSRGLYRFAGRRPVVGGGAGFSDRARTADGRALTSGRRESYRDCSAAFPRAAMGAADQASGMGPLLVLVILPVLIGLAAEYAFHDARKAALAAAVGAMLLTCVSVQFLDSTAAWSWLAALLVAPLPMAFAVGTAIFWYGHLNAHRRPRRHHVGGASST